MATTKPMDKMKDLLGYFLAAMAMFALLCAIYEAMNQRIASAGALGALFLVTALLFYLPQLEVIKAFGVEAKMRETLTEAQEIIARMKSLAEVNAEASYGLLAWGNRYGGMLPEEKQKLIDNIDLQLKSLGATDSDLVKLKSTALIPFIGYDIKDIFERTLSLYMSDTINSPESKTWLQTFQSGGWVTWEQLCYMDGAQLAGSLKTEIPTNIVRPHDVQRFSVLADKIGSLYDGCLKKQGYTPDVITFLNRFRGLHKDEVSEALNQD